ncbi:GlxA family transcriptional regulator [Labilithrix luteola]|nr:helix-turn-helix domain-containing protein [Labilithrix luteola]
MSPPVGVDVLLTERCFTSTVATTLDVLATANTLARALGAPNDLFEPRVLSVDGNAVRSTSGIVFPVEGAAREGRGSVVVVCGPGMADVRQITEYVSNTANRELLDVVVVARGRGALISASCSSTFMLAEAGILDGLRATTSWWLGPAFRARYPAVTLVEDEMLIDVGTVLTAGAALAHTDLMIHVLRRHAGPSLAEACARYLTVDDTRRSQNNFRIVEHLALVDSEVAMAERKIRENPAKPPSLAALARLSGLTPRTLSRRFVAATGMSPKRFLRRVRLELAAHLLRSSNDPIDAVAARVGYDDERAFRRAFTRELGSSPSRYRKTPTSPPNES